MPQLFHFDRSMYLSYTKTALGDGHLVDLFHRFPSDSIQTYSPQVSTLDNSKNSHPPGSTDVLSSRYRLGPSGERFATTSSISPCRALPRAGKSLHLHLGNTATGMPHVIA